MKKQYFATLYAISRFGTVPGKKALQKVLYFSNLKSNVFNFQWNTYGPYSEELQYLYDDAYLENVISVNKTPLQFTMGTQYDTTLSDKGKTYLKSLSKEPNIKKAVDFAYCLLKDKTPREMELLASVHYIASYEDTTNSTKIWEIINELKPKAHFTKENVKEAVSELKAMKLI